MGNGARIKRDDIHYKVPYALAVLLRHPFFWFEIMNYMRDGKGAVKIGKRERAPENGREQGAGGKILKGASPIAFLHNFI